MQQLITMMINASENTLKYWPGNPDAQELGLALKRDQSPLTQADLTTNAIICDTLTEMFPDIPIISEENREMPYSERQSYEWYWLVDPLDGTREFVGGGPDYTVNVGLMHYNMPVLGLVTQPTESVLYYGWSPELANFEGGKLVSTGSSYAVKTSYNSSGVADSRGLTGDPVELKCRPRRYSALAAPLRIVASKSHLNSETQAFLARFPGHECVNIGSSLKILKVASNGEADLYPRLGPTCEWDTAAAHAVLRAAGGSLQQIQRINSGATETRYQLQPFQYNKPNLLNPYFICGHPDLLSTINTT